MTKCKKCNDYACNESRGGIPLCKSHLKQLDDKTTKSMTAEEISPVRAFMLNKYPTDKYLDCPVPQRYWDVMQEFSDQQTTQLREEVESLKSRLRPDSTRLIGSVRERHKELIHKGYEYKSFYNGWLEGRVNLCFNDVQDKMGSVKITEGTILIAKDVCKDVTKKECPWLDRILNKSEVVYRYYGTTYGCISYNGSAFTLVKNETPFFELPNNSVQQLQQAIKEMGEG